MADTVATCWRGRSPTRRDAWTQAASRGCRRPRGASGSSCSASWAMPAGAATHRRVRRAISGRGRRRPSRSATPARGPASMSLAATLSYSGDFERSLELAPRAVALLDGDDRVVAMSQLAGLLQRAGRNRGAARVHRGARGRPSTRPTIHRGELWMNRGVLHGWAGDIDAAEDDTAPGPRALRAAGLDQAGRRHAPQPGVAGRSARRPRRGLPPLRRRRASVRRRSASAAPPCSPIAARRSLAAGLTARGARLAERAASDCGRTATTSTSPRR